MHHKTSSTIALAAVLFGLLSTATAQDVPLYRLFERTVTNDTAYQDRFNDVLLKTTFTAPSGKITRFWGFFDGDGKGGGSATSGNVWKFRFMPDETGKWSYAWTWSDGTPGGAGTFECVGKGAGPGILRAYAKNPHWFAYNGAKPVFLRSYHMRPYAVLTQPIGWVGPHVYQKLIDAGYNHLQFGGLLPIAYVDKGYANEPSVFQDKGAPAALRKNLMPSDDPSSMRLDVWHSTEDHLKWLNDRDIMVHCFQGFDGQAIGPFRFHKMNAATQRRYVRYVMARLAPLANIAAWNYTWETGGGGSELDLMRLLEEFDPWDHLRSYEDEKPQEHHFANPLYTFAGVENHGYPEGNYDSLSHHKAMLDGYVGKPVYMVEGNALWQAYWSHQKNAPRGDAASDAFRRSAWGVVTAGGSFTWDDWLQIGPNRDNKLTLTTADLLDDVDRTRAVNLLYDILTTRLAWHRMTPHDELLGDAHDRVYCLAEPGRQYLVFAEGGDDSFTLQTAPGPHRVTWVDASTGKQTATAVDANDGKLKLKSPDKTADWVALILVGPADTPGSNR